MILLPIQERNHILKKLVELLKILKKINVMYVIIHKDVFHLKMTGAIVLNINHVEMEKKEFVRNALNAKG